MHVRYISLPLLVAEAGGDPWAINKSLQVGRPGQISDLAEAFDAAGRCTTEASAAFDQARRRFAASWNHENGDHPINDSDEVQRVVNALGWQSLQIPKIGVDLENIAAALAEAQCHASRQIATLEAQLQQLDDLIGQALEEEEHGQISATEMSELKDLIAAIEDQAVNDTKDTLGQLVSTRKGYSDCLNTSLNNLRTEGYDPAGLKGLDSHASPDPTPLQNAELGDLRQLTDRAVLDQVAKVRAAQDAINKALATLYTNGVGSPEGEAAAQSLPKLKAELARALDDFGKVPDYTSIDPASVRASPDGHFMFTYTVNGQPVQVVGQLKNGTGEFFDQATGTNYTFKDGKLVELRTLDPGRAEATPEPLWTAITAAVGAPALKAGTVAAWQGLRTLFSRELLEAGGMGLTPDEVFPRAVAIAEQRAAAVQQDLTARVPPAGTGGLPTGELPGSAAQPGPVATVEHPAAGPGAGVGEHPPGGLPPPTVSDSPAPVVPDPGRPEFTLDNPLSYMPPELQALSEQHLTGSGETVLGPFNNPVGGPSYVDLAKQQGASYFDIGEAWNSFTPTEQLAANQHVLDIAIANRDTIKLSISIDMVNTESYTGAEIRYLQAHGYEIVDGYTLVPPKTGGRP
jgi:hypothetical protein